MSLKGESESLRHTMDELTRSNKEFDQLKRTIKKKQGIVDSAIALQPGLETQKSDVEAELATYKGESVLLKKQLKNLKQEVDVYIANFLRQEVIEKEKKTELEAQLKVIKDLESQITKWHAEEHRQRKTIQILTAQREIKAREAAKAQSLEKETQEELKVKKINYSGSVEKIQRDQFSVERIFRVVRCREKRTKQVCQFNSSLLSSIGRNERKN